MSEIWTPTLATVNKMANERSREIRPFVRFAAEAMKLGFETGIHHDAGQRTMQLRFLAKTDRAKAICASAMDNPECDRLVVGVNYGSSDNPIVVIAALWELGMQTLKEAL